MFQPPTRYLGSDSEIILSRIEEKEIDPTLLNAALKDINDRADGE